MELSVYGYIFVENKRRFYGEMGEGTQRKVRNRAA